MKNIIKYVSIFIGLVIVLVFLFLTIMTISKKEEKPSLNVSDGVDINKENEAKEDYTEIPVYKNIRISAKEPNAYFGNPEINNVYFRYNIYLKSGTSKNGGKVLFNDDSVIKPGRAFEVNLYDLLELGEYDVGIDVSTYDMDTEEQCNGASQEIKILVQ